MQPADPNSSPTQPVFIKLLYWIGLWLIAFDGLWLIFNLLLGSTAALNGLSNSLITHVIYGVIGGLICLSPLLTRTNSIPKILPITLFWAVYWTLILLSYLSHPQQACYNPAGSAACQQWRSLILIVAIPASLIYCGAIAALGSVFYQGLFYLKKTSSDQTDAQDRRNQNQNNQQ